MRIIVVEDEQRARHGLVELISSLNENYEVVAQAGNGEQGMNVIKVQKPDIAFVDIKMPIMDGLEMIKNLQVYELDTIYIIISAFTEFEYAKTALQLGVKDFLVKPVDVDELTYMLDKFSGEQSNIEKNGVYHPVVAKALKIIHKNYKQHINLDQLSSDLGMTSEYLSYVFRRDVGITYCNYIKNYRIKKACELMQERDDKIYNIAKMVGFSDSKYFCRVFRQIKGETPKCYNARISRETDY